MGNLQDVAFMEETIDVDGIGKVRMREISAAQLVTIKQTVEDPNQFGVALVAASVVDDAGNRIWDNNDDRQILFEWPMRLLSPLLEAAQRINGLNDDTKKN